MLRELATSGENLGGVKTFDLPVEVGVGETRKGQSDLCSYGCAGN